MGTRKKTSVKAKASSKADVKNVIKINIGDAKKRKRRKSSKKREPVDVAPIQTSRSIIYSTPLFPQQLLGSGVRQPIQPIQPNRNLGADVPNARLLTNIAERLGRIEASGDLLTRQVRETTTGLGELRSTMNLPRQERIKLESAVKKPKPQEREEQPVVEPKKGAFSGFFWRKPDEEKQPDSPLQPIFPQLRFSPPGTPPAENPALSRQAQGTRPLNRLPLASFEKMVLEKSRVEDLRDLASKKGVGFYRTKAEGKISPDKKPGDKYTKERLIQRILEHDIENGDLFDDLGEYSGGGGAFPEGRIDDDDI